MSLLATAYRFERENCNAKALKKAMGRQAARIKEDEEFSDRSFEEQANSRVNEIAKWSESLEEASDKRKVRREIKSVNEELKCSGKALVKVRKAQLANLLEGEKRKYESELKALGKAFYIERL
ncbi:uncharacterized protein LOC135682159 [Rhopilema esculentum]|uniref:uncharacterized protein LOC135682159 n=1 Tax=Rhopilema esculentum TaxID=499914 RepID=UPI0031DC0085|eukprot:gene14170-5174_t